MKSPLIVSCAITSFALGLVQPNIASAQVGSGYAGPISGSVGGQVTQQLYGTFGTPTIASGACGTGSNGTISGTNQSGVITIGTAATTSCVITFSPAMNVKPNSIHISPGNAAAAASGTAGAYVNPNNIGTSGFTITGSALASTIYYYWVF